MNTDFFVDKFEWNDLGDGKKSTEINLRATLGPFMLRVRYGVWCSYDSIMERSTVNIYQRHVQPLVFDGNHILIAGSMTSIVTGDPYYMLYKDDKFLIRSLESLTLETFELVTRHIRSIGVLLDEKTTDTNNS